MTDQPKQSISLIHKRDVFSLKAVSQKALESTTLLPTLCRF